MSRSKEANFVISSNVSRLITSICNSSKKSQAEIAQEMGLNKPNIITMIKQGRIKMPLARIPSFSAATNSDPVLLLNEVLAEDYPAILNVLLEVGSITLDPDEKALISKLRESGRMQQLAKSWLENTNNT